VGYIEKTTTMPPVVRSAVGGQFWTAAILMERSIFDKLSGVWRACNNDLSRTAETTR
jgi:hypothetical protein